MRATTLVRQAARAGPSSAASSSKPKPASHAKHAPFLPNGKAPVGTLRTLVDLHHSAATFMRDPSEIPTAFENAHRQYRTEFFQFNQFTGHAIKVSESYGAHATGGAKIGRMAERSPGMPGGRSMLGEEKAPAPMARPVRNVFAARTLSGTGGRGANVAARARSHGLAASGLTERELLVKEAILGMWERGSDDVTRPGLEGVLDVVAAKGATVSSAAAEWRQSDVIDENTTEDGM